MSTPQLDLKKPAEPAAEEAKAEVKEEKLGNDALTKYQTASSILGDVLKKFIPTVVEGKSVLDLCNECVLSCFDGCSDMTGTSSNLKG